MPKMMDYILWRGDLSPEAFPINQVDLALLTQLPLLDLSNIFQGDETLTLKEMFQRYDELDNDSERRKALLIYRRIYDAFKVVSNSSRYMNILISDYVEIIREESPCQFSAITLHLGDDMILCYGGTDDTVVGWHEDFQLLYLEEIPSHKHGLEYLEEMSKKYDKNIMLCGHSKGAHIAMNTLLMAPNNIINRILKVYCFDGPGINKKDFDNELYKERIEKITSYIPYRSSIGKLFDHYEKYKIVKCSANLLFQHDVLTWHVTTSDFIYSNTESEDSIHLDSCVKKLISELDEETKKTFVSSLFNVLYISDIANYRDAIKSKRKIVGNVLRLKKEERKIFNKVILKGMLKDPKIRKMLLSILLEKNKID